MVVKTVKDKGMTGKVKIKKSHSFFEKIFKVGKVYDTEENYRLILTEDGRKYHTNDLCKVFGNGCSLKDVLEKLD